MLNLVILLCLHWVADFVLQSDNIAKSKSKSLTALLEHTFVYSTFVSALFTIAYIVTVPYATDLVVLLLSIFTILFVSHTGIDFLTSKWTTRLFNAGKRHDFFVVIGLDQLLHGLILIGMLAVLGI